MKMKVLQIIPTFGVAGAEKAVSYTHLTLPTN